MERILYIGNQVEHIRMGSEVVNKRNISFLRQIFGERMDIVEFSNARNPERKATWKSKLCFRLLDIEQKAKQKMESDLEAGRYGWVFISLSLTGRLVKEIKKKSPSVKIICCYHNIEKQYARELLRSSGWRHCFFYLAAIYNERLSVKYSDYSLVLNNRDAALLQKEYKKKADLILPAAYDDAFDERRCCLSATSHEQITYLFVGGAFFGNQEGVEWFISEVLPFVPGKLLIAGRGMEQRSNYPPDRVKVLGFVDDLAELYYSSTFVVLPIFSGGGMKTKTAEALMYGKTVIGTREAFEGYQLNDKATFLCHSARQFIDTINDLIHRKMLDCYNPDSRTLYLQNYSYDVLFNRFKGLFLENSCEH